MFLICVLEYVVPTIFRLRRVDRDKASLDAVVLRSHRSLPKASLAVASRLVEDYAENSYLYDPTGISRSLKRSKEDKKVILREVLRRGNGLERVSHGSAFAVCGVE